MQNEPIDTSTVFCPFTTGNSRSPSFAILFEKETEKKSKNGRGTIDHDQGYFQS